MRNRHLHYPMLLWALLCAAASGTQAIPIAERLDAISASLSASGSNELRIARGYNISGNSEMPWNYLVNSSDIRVGVRRLYTKLRFDIEEPSIGFNPAEPVYREYLSRRTLGFDNNLLTIEAGHVATQFGRGLTLSLKEDREVELYSILDGVFGQIRHQLFTVQAVVGRPLQRRSSPVSLLKHSNEPTYTNLVLDEKDPYFRDLVTGAYAEFFMPVDKAPLAFLSSGSISGGIVRYAAEVGPLASVNKDTLLLWYQDRKEFYLPSIAGSFTVGNYGFSAENVWMTRREHLFDAIDTSDQVTVSQPGNSAYVSATATLSAVTLTAEYKNYFYDRNKTFSQELSKYLVPPGARYIHSWHLLSKHQFSNLMNDIIGYNLLVNWQATGAAMLTADISFGGRHSGQSMVNIDTGAAYWEAYAEWTQELGDHLNFKLGFDWGRIDPDVKRVTFRTLACDIEAGPFAKRHSFGLIIESQLNDKLFFAEKDPEALKALIIRTIPPDLLGTPSDYTTEDLISRFDPLIPESLHSRYTKYAFNLLTTLSYGISPWLLVAVTLEHATGFADDNVHLVSELASPERNYASVGVSVKPSDNHTITVEYGSMSGGKKCTLGTCVDLPPFKGLKVTAVSRF